MIEVTEAATQKVADYFNGKEIAPIRIFLNESGWGGPSLAMALDEPKDSDEIYDVEGFKYIVDKEFMEKVKPIKIDFMGLGFKLDCGIQFQKSECGGCGTTSDCCS